MSTANASFTIRVNDEPRTLSGPMTLDALVRELGLADRKGVAVAINNVVVPRSTWATHALGNEDRVLVIRATQGG
jgi:sulfur carrier protein